MMEGDLGNKEIPHTEQPLKSQEIHSKPNSHVQNGILKSTEGAPKKVNGQPQHHENNATVENSDDLIFTSDLENSDAGNRAPLLSHGSSYKSEETPTNADTTILESLAGSVHRNVGREKKPSDGDSMDTDTQSDSIETLEEESSHEDTTNDLSDSLVQQISLTKHHEGTPSVNDATEQDMSANGAGRPDSLSLPRPLQQGERTRSSSEVQLRVVKPVQTDRSRTQSEIIDIKPRRRIDELNSEGLLSKSLPQGTILRKGEMIEFVAEDLQEKIRRSSPLSRTDSSCYSSRRSSLRSVSSSTSASTSMATSTASGMSRSPSSLFQQSPDDIPPIDPQAVLDLENQAHLVADSVDLMLGNLRGNLHKMSSITTGCLDAYRMSVDVACDSVDGSIKSMYALMAKCEELSKQMQPVYKLSEKIKEIKRLLDLFEAQLSDKT